jgi:hypothetical protein
MHCGYEKAVMRAKKITSRHPTIKNTSPGIVCGSKEWLIVDGKESLELPTFKQYGAPHIRSMELLTYT